MARRAKATQTLLDQVNEVCPARNKGSDGWIGDTAHQSTKSDHNPNSAGVVQAQDITHDPKGGFELYKFAEHLRTHKDKRVKYVISNRKIFSGNAGPQPWVWRSYSGKNPHDAHVHVSVGDAARSTMTSQQWRHPVHHRAAGYRRTRRHAAGASSKAAEGFYVEMLQTLLGFVGEEVDGDFGNMTDGGAEAVPARAQAGADGICGVYSWRELMRPWAKEIGLLPNDPKVKLVEMALVAQQTGSTASLDELVTAFVAVLDGHPAAGVRAGCGEGIRSMCPIRLPATLLSGLMKSVKISPSAVLGGGHDLQRWGLFSSGSITFTSQVGMT